MKISKSNFYENKKLPKTDYIDFKTILVSKKESYDKKNSLIGYNDGVIRPLCIMNMIMNLITNLLKVKTVF